MDNMKETILRDGEVAILIGGAEVIMNVNTALELAAKLAAGCKPAEPETPQATVEVLVGKIQAPNLKPACSYPIANQNVPEDGTIIVGRGRPVIAFLYDKQKVEETGNRYEGFTARYKYYTSAREAEEDLGICKGRVSSVACTWEYILDGSWSRGRKNQMAPVNVYCGTRDWGYQNAYTVETEEGTMAFIYLADLPSGKNNKFVV